MSYSEEDLQEIVGKAIDMTIKKTTEEVADSVSTRFLNFLENFAQTYCLQFPKDKRVISDFMVRYYEAWSVELDMEAS